MRTAERTEKESFLARLRSFVGKPIGPPFTARDRVNLPMIRHWCDAMGDGNPVYTDEGAARRSVHGGVVAPPTMLQAWTMRGLSSSDAPHAGGLPRELVRLLDDAGFTGVVATNCEQVYARYLRPDDLLTGTTTVAEVSEEKNTALGVGHFITSEIVWTDEDGAIVGRQMFRLLKFKPAERPTPGAAAPQTAARPRPAISDDTRFVWEGARRGELLMQRCASCGRLRHPPRPMCGDCRSLEWEPVRACGRGAVHSFVVHHYPPVPGFEPPFVVALVELEEGPRIVSNIVGVAPERVSVGMPVEVTFEQIDETLTVPLFRAREA